jgi:hypothetical protein
MDDNEMNRLCQEIPWRKYSNTHILRGWEYFYCFGDKLSMVALGAVLTYIMLCVGR